MRTHIRQLLAAAIETVRAKHAPAPARDAEIIVAPARDEAHGDYATPIALALAQSTDTSPRALANRIIAALPRSTAIADVSIGGPGFINFRLSHDARANAVRAILRHGPRGPAATLGGAKRVQVEFVSANPTGPLHVGHGRGAACGASIANLLEATGHDVQREYYVNDAGRQMQILTLSVWLRYLERNGQSVAFPAGAYQGAYIEALAQRLHETVGSDYAHAWADIAERAQDGAANDPEAALDALVAAARATLGAERERHIRTLARDRMVAEIATDLTHFGVHFDRWFSEQTLVEHGALKRTITALRERGHVYARDGAQWFRSSAFGDEKDRVLVRRGGQPTYLATDIAYARNKFERGFERIIYVWGADHHGYTARLTGAVEALGYNRDAVEIKLVQLARLHRSGARIPMSTRRGTFVALRTLREEIGTDAARCYYVMRRAEQHLDFDLDQAKATGNENPVHYIQYAHARIAGLLRTCAERGLDAGTRPDAAIERLTDASASALIRTLAEYPETLASAAQALEPHIMMAYLRDLAAALHRWYGARKILVDDAGVRAAHLALATATATVLADALALLGAQAPDTMARQTPAVGPASHDTSATQ